MFKIFSKETPKVDFFGLSGFMGYEYSLDYNKFLQNAYDNPFFYICLRELIDDFNSAEIYAAKKDKEGNYTKSDNPINKALKRPNADLTQSKMQEYYLTWLMLGGSVLLWKSKGINKKELRVYAPDTFSIKRDKETLEIVEIKVGNRSYKGEDLLDFHLIKSVNPTDSIAGVGIGRALLKSGATIGDLSNYGLQHQTATLKNSGKRTGILEYKRQMNAKQKDELEEAINGDVQKAGIMALNGEDYKFTPLDLNSKELSWLESMQYVQKLIAGIMGIPAPLVTFQDATYNNLEGYKKKLYNDTIIPLWKDYVEELNFFFAEDLKAGEEIIYDTSNVKELQENNIEVIEKLCKSLVGVVTLNELRTMLNQMTGTKLQPLSKDLGDRILTTSNAMWLDDVGFE